VLLHSLLCLAPALAMALMLLGRRYPGERVLIALRRKRVVLPRHRAIVTGARGGRSVEVLMARGGALLGFALAVRPPPAPASAPAG
jgi:hypothetical protein